jgi:biotin transport system substrate-specific component
MAGLALGSRLGFLSQTLYLGAGAMGAPVFQGFTGGSSALVHITAGYLWAFPLAAFLAGYLAEKGWDRSVLSSFTSMFLAQALILVLGTLWLSFYVGGLKTAWTLGCAPFLAVECLKALGLGVIMPGAWSLVKR